MHVCFVVLGLPTLHKQIVHVDFHVAPDLVFKHMVYQPLVRGANVF